MRILFLDQSGNPGGAELCLLDIAQAYRHNCLVALFADGLFRTLLEQEQIPVTVLGKKPINVHKESSFFQGLASLGQLTSLIKKVIELSKEYDLIYANTQKALVVGALASLISGVPLVYHLHDILSPEHFSPINRYIAVNLANWFAKLVIANSQASQQAFVAAGGNAKLTEIVYNGFNSEIYQINKSHISQLRKELGLEGKFAVGLFSRLSPWKGQHILIEALMQCPENVVAVLVGDALFGEHEYVQKLHEQLAELRLQHRVKFLGFRDDVPQLMMACDLIAHTSTAAEPFGRVVVEAMLCGKPVVASAAGGVLEIVEPGVNGFLCQPGDVEELAEVITNCHNQPEYAATIATTALNTASQRFNVDHTNQQIAQLLHNIIRPLQKNVETFQTARLY